MRLRVIGVWDSAEVPGLQQKKNGRLEGKESCLVADDKLSWQEKKEGKKEGAIRHPSRKPNVEFCNRVSLDA